MKLKKMQEEIEIPAGVEAQVDKNLVTIKGKKGELKKMFPHHKVNLERKEKMIIISSDNATKREKMVMGSFSAHINNMMKGVVDGHTYRLKICSGHFPMNVSVSGQDFIVKNFLGEKVPRVLKLKGGVSVRIEGSDVVVESPDKELAGQAAADIEKLTTIKGRDLRIFQDGIYITNKDGKDMSK